MAAVTQPPLLSAHETTSPPPYIAYAFIEANPDTYEQAIMTLRGEGLGIEQIPPSAPIPSDAEIVIYIGKEPNPLLATRVMNFLRDGGALLATVEREAMVEHLKKSLGLHVREESLVPLGKSVVNGATGLARVSYRGGEVEFVVDGAVALQTAPWEIDGPSLEGGMVERVFTDVNGNGREDDADSVESISVSDLLSLPGTGRSWLISDAAVFSDRLMSTYEGNRAYLATAIAWLKRSADKRRRLRARALPWKVGGACESGLNSCSGDGRAKLGCRAGRISEDVLCKGPKGCKEFAEEMWCDEPSIDIRRFLDQEFPAALQRRSQEARALGSRFALVVTGENGGHWVIDLSAPSVTRSDGAPSVACEITIDARGFHEFFEAPGVLEEMRVNGGLCVDGKCRPCADLRKVFDLRND